MQQEDLMGKIKQLMIKCVQSAKPITAVHKAYYILIYFVCACANAWCLLDNASIQQLKMAMDTFLRSEF